MDGSAESETLTFVVKGCFHVRGRGFVLAPVFEAEKFPHDTRLEVEVAEPDGERRRARGRFVLEHVRAAKGASRWDGVVLLDEDAGRVQPGSEVTCVEAVEPDGG